jgi:hypothetical protein
LESAAALDNNTGRVSLPREGRIRIAQQELIHGLRSKTFFD